MASSTSPTQASDFEVAVSSLLSLVGHSATSTAPPYSDDVFDKLSRYVEQAGKVQWSLRPRTYLVLRLINRLDSMDAFVLDGLFDIALPYTYSRLPVSLSPGPRNSFLEKQELVMTKAGDLEIEGGRHRHFSSAAETNFVVVKELGRGYSGVVDHVRSKLSMEEYARKRISRARTFSKDRKALKVFENELSNLQRLSHRHLVKYVGSYTDPQYIALLTSPVADCDLKIYLTQNPFPTNLHSLLRSFFGCLCSALSYLHSQKCRHKDIKPGNILVKNDTVLVTDFGTSRNWSDRSRGTTTGESGLYTPGYAAPEVVAWKARNESSDIWSLGCVYLDMLSILKGETLSKKDQFFSENGNGGRNPRVNSQALHLWLSKLKAYGYEDNQPIVWIRKMLEVGPKDRISSVNLLDEVLGYLDEDKHIYDGLCCSDQEAEVSSCHSSESAEEYMNTDEEHAEDSTNATSIVSTWPTQKHSVESKPIQDNVLDYSGGKKPMPEIPREQQQPSDPGFSSNPSVIPQSENSQAPPIAVSDSLDHHGERLRHTNITNGPGQAKSAKEDNYNSPESGLPVVLNESHLSVGPKSPSLSSPPSRVSRNPFKPGYVPPTKRELLEQVSLVDLPDYATNPFISSLNRKQSRDVSENEERDSELNLPKSSSTGANVTSSLDSNSGYTTDGHFAILTRETDPILFADGSNSKSAIGFVLDAAAKGVVAEVLEYCTQGFQQEVTVTVLPSFTIVTFET
ncbi:kinase-like domain-containing protein [Clohesyomyces aquaticus]|uniref:non-specific serine/threonine protein kinase n=1 Tax=Clohesyomyces aquaticus TaxID=1231657 RepID=A0A1Y1YJK7_9PLEO|nr:kinase-like domain-containing protein [Clohesyomyces aquaticus]